MPNQEAAVIAEVLKQQWLFRFGTGTSLQSHTDKGMNFTSAAFKELSLILGIEKIQTTQFRRQWSTKNWRFEEWFNNTLKNNTIRCKKLATIVSNRKSVARPFFRRKQVSTSAEM